MGIKLSVTFIFPAHLNNVMSDTQCQPLYDVYYTALNTHHGDTIRKGPSVDAMKKFRKYNDLRLKLVQRHAMRELS